MNNADWSQKYRPSKFEDVILPEDIRLKLSEVVKSKGGISLLFYGRPGCGKTTIGKLINPENTIYINCTTRNSIDMVRWLEDSCVCGTISGERRLILLDEADYLTKDAQAALRGVVEYLSGHNDFVMTANDPNQLSEAIRSRFLPVRFDYTNSNFVKQKMKDRLIHIASMEGFSNVDDESLEKTVNENFPDMRRMTKSLQFELNQ